jgi:hypothetical protein
MQVYLYGSGSYIKVIQNAVPALTFTESWRFKTSLSINSGTGQYLSTTNGFRARVGSTYSFGIVCKWNSPNIDIYAFSYKNGTTTESLLTSIADTGLSVKSECSFTPATNVICSVTVSGTTYSATITTNLPEYGGLDLIRVMDLNAVGVHATQYAVINVFEWSSVQT